MPLSKYPIEIPLGGAVDEGNVPEIVQPPRILEARNCHSITGGAYQKKDDDLAVSVPPVSGEAFAVGTVDETVVAIGDRQALAWTGAQWDRKFPAPTVRGEMGAFYPSDGGEVNTSPDVAVIAAQPATNDEERACVAWVAADPSPSGLSTSSRVLFRVFGGEARRPLGPDAPSTSTVSGAVWVRAVAALGSDVFALVQSTGTQFEVVVLTSEGVPILLHAGLPGHVVDVVTEGPYLYILLADTVAPPAFFADPQATDIQIWRMEISTGALTALIPPVTPTFEAFFTAPCGLFLIGGALNILFSNGEMWTVPLGGGAVLSVATIIDPVGDKIGTGPAVAPAPTTTLVYLPPGQARAQGFCSYDAASEQAWIGINTQKFQVDPLFIAGASRAASGGDEQPQGRPVGTAEYSSPYAYPSWSNGLYGCAYVEHVLVDLSPLGVPSPVAGTQGALQGAAIAGGGYYSRETGHTAVFSTPAPANILSDYADRDDPPGPPPATVETVFTVAREDWVQPTVMWCTRTSVQEYDRLTEKPAPAPANFEVRNQALSICTLLANGGTLYPVRQIVRDPGTGEPDALAPVGLQNDPGTGPRPSIVPTAGGVVIAALEWGAAAAPIPPASEPLEVWTSTVDFGLGLPSTQVRGELTASRPRVFDFSLSTSLDARPDGPGLTVAGPQPAGISGGQPVGAGNCLQSALITYGVPMALAVPGGAIGAGMTAGGVEVTSGTIRNQNITKAVFEGAPWPPGAGTLGADLYACAVRLRTSFSSIDADDRERRSLPWLPPPAAPFPWFGQTLYSPTGGTGIDFPDAALPRSVAALATPVAWQLWGVPDAAVLNLDLYACGDEGEPSRCASFPLPLVVDWNGPSAAVWRLGRVFGVGLASSLPYVDGDGALLYTEAGELAADAPPPLRAITATGGRLFGIDSTDPRQVFYTKQVREGYAPEWNRNLSFRVNDSAEELTALGALPDGRLVLFSANTTYYTYGDGPSDTGQGAGFAEPALLSRDVGCRDWRSIAEGTFGVMFRGERGIHLVDRQLSMQFVGLPYELTTEREILVTSTAVDAYRSEVSFFIDTPGPFGDQCWTYNYLRNQWSSYTGAEVISATEQGANVALLTSAPPRTYAVRERTPSPGEDLMSLRTGWLAMGKIQGYGRTWEVQLTGIRDPGSLSGLRVEIYYDYIDTPFETYDFDDVGNGQFKVRFRPRKQKSEAISFRFSEYIPAGVLAANCTGWRLDMCTVLAGVKAGLDKVAVTTRSS